MVQPQSPYVADGGGLAPVSLFPPPVSYALGASLAVFTAAWLGADWLREPVAGLPAGAWLIAASAAFGWSAARRRAGERAPTAIKPAGADGSPTSEQNDGVPSLIATAEHPPSAPLARSAWLRWIAPRIADAWEAFRFVGAIGTQGDDPLDRLDAWLSTRHDRAVAWPSAPLRVGIDIPDSLGAALLHAKGEATVEWVPLRGDLDDAAAFRRLRLDAIVRRQGHGPVRVSIAERPGREAAWYDWSSPPPLTLASLFPARIDPAKVTLGWVDDSDADEAALLRSLIECSAALARSPERITLADRIAGRRPTLAAAPVEALRTSARADGDLAERCLGRLAELLAAKPRSAREATPAQRAAAWVASAWLSTPRPSLDAGARLKGVEAACAILGNEPEALLRLVAARFAAFEDEGAMDAVLAADRAIRERETEPVIDHLAFVQSEVDLGLPAPATLGRVAAGICLVCATHPFDQLPYLRDDLTDDMRYAGWLIGRDQDRAVLLEVFRTLERTRQEARRAVAAAA